MTRGFVIIARGFVIMTRGFVSIARGFVIIAKGFVIIAKGFVIMMRGYFIMAKAVVKMMRAVVFGRGEMLCICHLRLTIENCERQLFESQCMHFCGYGVYLGVGSNAKKKLDMTILDEIKLDEYEDEDIFDVVAKLEKSFAIKFDKNAFINVKTFGDLCDVIESNIKYDDKKDCTKQQAFYKIRLAISQTQLIDKRLINLDTKLVDLFPHYDRRTQVKKFQRKLGVNLRFLTYSGWLALILLVGLLASFVAFFFDWKIAVSGIVFFAFAFNIAEKLGKDLELETVKELTEKAVSEFYVDMRRSKSTVNRNEILDTIKDAFSSGLAIGKEQLTRDAKFSWA